MNCENCEVYTLANADLQGNIHGGLETGRFSDHTPRVCRPIFHSPHHIQGAGLGDSRLRSLKVS